jgi:sulfur-oxidizing protein SoxY
LNNRMSAEQASTTSTRRQVLSHGLGVAAWVVVRPARASTEELIAAIRAFAGNATVREGRVLLDIAPLVENGNTVPITVSVQSAMTQTDHVHSIAVFNQLNPQREVALFQLGPRAGLASVSTRIRLATSQKLVALARLSDGSVWSHSVDVIVTLAACIE